MQIALFFLVGYGITTIITKSDIFEPLRNALDNGGETVRTNFFGILINCPMCIGFWVGCFLSLFLFSPSISLFPSSQFGYQLVFHQFLCTIGDGSFIGALSWTIHSFLGYIEKKYEYLETKEAYILHKAKKNEDDVNILND